MCNKITVTGGNIHDFVSEWCFFFFLVVFFNVSITQIHIFMDEFGWRQLTCCFDSALSSNRCWRTPDKKWVHDKCTIAIPHLQKWLASLWICPPLRSALIHPGRRHFLRRYFQGRGSWERSQRKFQMKCWLLTVLALKCRTKGLAHFELQHCGIDFQTCSEGKQIPVLCFSVKSVFALIHRLHSARWRHSKDLWSEQEAVRDTVFGKPSNQTVGGRHSSNCW